MLFVLHFDSPYMKWARIFIKTINIFEPKSKIYINGINLHKKNIYELRNFENVIEINNRKLKEEKVITDRSKGGGWMAQIISMRASMFLDAINKYPEEDIYITCDVDMLLLKNLDNLRIDMIDNDLGLCVFPEKTRDGRSLNRNKVMATFICARKTKAAIKYLKRWKKLCDGKFVRTIDQIALVKAYDEMKDNLNVYTIPKTYLDAEFKMRSYLWSAHKSRTGGKKMKLKLFSYFLDNINQDLPTIKNRINQYRFVNQEKETLERKLSNERAKIKDIESELKKTSEQLNKIKKDWNLQR